MSQPEHELMQFFSFDHLPPHLRAVSEPFAEAAKARAVLKSLHAHVESLPKNSQSKRAVFKLWRAHVCFARIESSVEPDADLFYALSHLLEAKDCAVRAVLFRAPEPKP